MSKHEAMKRYLNYIGNYFMYSDNMHDAYQYGERSAQILNKAHFLHLPKNKFQYIGIDLDWEGSASLWMDEGYPEPTITIVTSKSGHSKYFYELKVPVTLPLNLNQKNINTKPFKYYSHVKRGLTEAFGGDYAYSGKTMNNPFLNIIHKQRSYIFDGVNQTKWVVHWADKTYDLDYLSEYTKSTAKDYSKKLYYDIEKRHNTMFHLTRLESYKLARKCESFEIFLFKLTEAALSYWSELRLIQKDHPLEESEAYDIARSVAKWSWLRRNEPWLRRFTWDLGKLGFEQIDCETMSEDEINSERKIRQQKGALYTHKKRTKQTELKIKNACELLSKSGEKLTRANIAKTSGVGESTLGRYTKLIKKYKFETL